MPVSRFEKPAKQEIYDTYVPLPLDNIQKGMEYIGAQEDNAKDSMDKIGLAYSSLKNTGIGLDPELYNKEIQKEQAEDQSAIDNYYKTGNWRDLQNYARNKAIKVSRYLQGQGPLGELHARALEREKALNDIDEAYKKNPEKYDPTHPEKEKRRIDYLYGQNTVGDEYLAKGKLSANGIRYNSGQLALFQDANKIANDVAEKVRASVRQEGGRWVATDIGGQPIMAKTKREIEELTENHIADAVKKNIETNQSLQNFIDKDVDYDLYTMNNGRGATLENIASTIQHFNDPKLIEKSVNEVANTAKGIKDPEARQRYLNTVYKYAKKDSIVNEVAKSVAPTYAYRKVKSDQDLHNFNDAWLNAGLDKQEYEEGKYTYSTEKTNPEINLIDPKKSPANIIFTDFLKGKGYTQNEDGDWITPEGKNVGKTSLSAGWKWTNKIGLYNVPEELEPVKDEFNKFVEAKAPSEQIKYYAKSDPYYNLVYNRINKEGKSDKDIHSEVVDKSNKLKQSTQRLNIAIGDENGKYRQQRKEHFFGEKPTGDGSVISGPVLNYTIKNLDSGKEINFNDIPIGNTTVGNSKASDVWSSIQSVDVVPGKGTTFKIGNKTYYAEDGFSNKDARLFGKDSPIGRFTKILDNPVDEQSTLVSSFELPELNKAYGLNPERDIVYMSHVDPSTNNFYVLPARLKQDGSIQKLNIKDPIPLDEYTKVYIDRQYNKVTRYNQK